MKIENYFTEYEKGGMTVTDWDKAIQKTPWIYTEDEGIRMMEEIMQAQEEEKEEE